MIIIPPIDFMLDAVRSLAHKCSNEKEAFMKSYATRKRAENAMQEAGFVWTNPGIMGAAGWRRGHSYAWIEEDWCRRHCKMRFFVHARG